MLNNILRVPNLHMDGHGRVCLSCLGEQMDPESLSRTPCKKTGYVHAASSPSGVSSKEVINSFWSGGGYQKCSSRPNLPKLFIPTGRFHSIRFDLHLFLSSSYVLSRKEYSSLMLFTKLPSPHPKSGKRLEGTANSITCDVYSFINHAVLHFYRQKAGTPCRRQLRT